jgi:hypothetical protein
MCLTTYHMIYIISITTYVAKFNSLEKHGAVRVSRNNL